MEPSNKNPSTSCHHLLGALGPGLHVQPALSWPDNPILVREGHSSAGEAGIQVYLTLATDLGHPFCLSILASVSPSHKARGSGPDVLHILHGVTSSLLTCSKTRNGVVVYLPGDLHRVLDELWSRVLGRPFGGGKACPHFQHLACFRGWDHGFLLMGPNLPVRWGSTHP